MKYSASNKTCHFFCHPHDLSAEALAKGVGISAKPRHAEFISASLCNFNQILKQVQDDKGDIAETPSAYAIHLR